MTPSPLSRSFQNWSIKASGVARRFESALRQCRQCRQFGLVLSIPMETFVRIEQFHMVSFDKTNK